MLSNLKLSLSGFFPSVIDSELECQRLRADGSTKLVLWPEASKMPVAALDEYAAQCIKAQASPGQGKFFSRTIRFSLHVALRVCDKLEETQELY